VGARAEAEADQALEHHRHPDRRDEQRDRLCALGAERGVEQPIDPERSEDGEADRDRQGEIGQGQRAGHTETGKDPAQPQRDEGAQGHHVAMGEMREAEDAEDERHPDRAEGIDRAGDQPGNDDVVEEEDELVHAGRVPPRKLRATSGSSRSCRPVPV
jgi:hypothetical protein